MLFFICVFLSVTAAASAMDVEITKIERTSYGYLQGYGFYDKCANYSQFRMVLTNTGSKAYTVSFPETGKIGTTYHPLANMQYREIGYESENFNDPTNPRIPFTGEFTLPARTTYAVFLDAKDFEPYNLYWDTDLFFSIQVKDGSTKVGDISVAGKLIRRGDACGDDRSCFADFLNGSYNGAGGGNVTIQVRNDMPDWTYVTGQPDVTISWKDSNGETQSRTVENGVTWDRNPGSLNSGDAAIVTGVLNLPTEITAANTALDLEFHFTRPSSTPGYKGFYAQGSVKAVSGFYAVLSGNFDTDGINGTFSATFYNNQTFPVTLKIPSASKDAAAYTLPSEGTVKDSNGKSNTVALNWSGSDITIEAGKTATLNGDFTFKQTDLIQSNSSLILSADLTGDGTASASGTITRNADPNPLLTASSFCRNYQAGSKKMTFRYMLENRSNISIRTELATTMAIPGQYPNPKIRYTDCLSSNGSSCLSRISYPMITLAAHESAVFTGEVDLYTATAANATAQTSLRYFPDNKTIALFVGRTADSCSGSVKPTPVPAAIPVGYDLETVSTCRNLDSANKVAYQYTLRNKTAQPISLELAQTLAVQGQDGVVDILYSGCEKNGSACAISGKNFTIGAGETVKFNASSTLAKAPAVQNFTVRTSLVYQTNGKTKAYFIGRWNNDCASSAPVPAQDQEIKSTAFCRTLSADKSKATIQYTLENSSQNTVNVQLAQNLSLPNQPRYLPITYKTCTSSAVETTDCKARILVYDILMNPNESITVSGEVDLDNPISTDNFGAYTSLIYNVNGERKVLNLGTTYDTCSPSVSKDAESAFDEDFSNEAILDGYVSSSYISSCDNRNTLHFNLKINNSGTADKIIDLSAISVKAGETQIPVKVSSCAEMSASGTNNVTCKSELPDGFLAIDPNVTMSLDIVADEISGSGPMTIQALVPDVSAEPFEFTADAYNSVCGPAIETETDSGDDAVSCSVSAAKNAVSLGIVMVNYGSADASVFPGSIYFTRDVIDNYSGEVIISSLVEPGTVRTSAFAKGDRITIPAESRAAFTVNMSANLSEAFSSTAKLNWHFDINGQPVNYTGTLNFAQKSVDAAEVIGKSVLQPEKNISRNTLHFYNIGEPRLPETLPATGLTGSGIYVGLSQPADLKYQELNGLHLEIPVIDAEMDLVKVPLDENNEWAVEWLGDRGGVLSAGALPGKGTSLIAAHNHLDEMNAGPFKMLQYLGMKDRIFITDAKGKLLSFSVYHNELLTPNDGELLYQKAIPGSLVLVTCEDELPEGGYAFRRVVYAEPLQ